MKLGFPEPDSNSDELRWLGDFLTGKTITGAHLEHDAHGGVVKIVLHLTAGTVVLTANYGEHDEQDAVIDWEVIWPTPIVYGPTEAGVGSRSGYEFAVIVCRDCDGAEIPFPSAAERGRWASAHTEATGHRSFRVFDA